jgi:hypothetical protein
MAVLGVVDLSGQQDIISKALAAVIGGLLAGLDNVDL